MKVFTFNTLLTLKSKTLEEAKEKLRKIAKKNYICIKDTKIVE